MLFILGEYYQSVCNCRWSFYLATTRDDRYFSIRRRFCTAVFIFCDISNVDFVIPVVFEQRATIKYRVYCTLLIN